MTDKLREAAQQALEALINARDTTDSDTLFVEFDVTIAALRAALAQQDAQAIYQYQKSDGSWIDQTESSYKYNAQNGVTKLRVLYAAPTPPAQQEWIDDAGRLQWALWRIKDLEQQLAGRPAVITPPAQSDDEHLLRLLLAIRVAGVHLYADDGEMSDCSEQPHIDFKRDSVKEIERKLIERGTKKAWASITEYAAPTPPAPKPLGWLDRKAVECLQGSELNWMPAWNRPVGEHPVPVYGYPSKRATLTDEEIRDLWSWSMTAEAERTANTQQHAFAQGVIEAYERKNGIAQPCWCQACRPITINDMRMVLCPKCGSKRCPHANDHRNPCTGSNEPGQPGSAYPAK